MAERKDRQDLTHKRAGAAVLRRIVVLITILVIARKLMLQDYASIHYESLLGFGGLLLALGALYWLISDGDRRRAQAAAQEPTDARS